MLSALKLSNVAVFISIPKDEKRSRYGLHELISLVVEEVQDN